MTITGSCECGAVVFELSGKLRDVVACHCGQCRKTSGHYWAATSVPTPQLHSAPIAGLNVVSILGCGAARVLQGLRIELVLSTGR